MNVLQLKRYLRRAAIVTDPGIREDIESFCASLAERVGVLAFVNAPLATDLTEEECRRLEDKIAAAVNIFLGRVLPINGPFMVREACDQIEQRLKLAQCVCGAASPAVREMYAHHLVNLLSEAGAVYGTQDLRSLPPETEWNPSLDHWLALFMDRTLKFILASA